MLALIYLGLAICLGDLVCRRFYRFVSVLHRWAAAVLVGILLSTWLTYLAGLTFSHTAEPLLSADLLFFLVAPGAIFWLSRKAPKVDMIAPRAPGSSRWDWITLGALFAAACFLLIGTLYINKQDRLRLSGMEVSDFALLFAIAQNFAFGYNFPTEFPHYAGQPNHYQFLFYFQAGNLNLLGLNLPWSVDVLSVLGLISMISLVMAMGELLFNSRVVGRLGATLFFFHGSVRHLTSFLPSEYSPRAETWTFWKQMAFVNQRHLPFMSGIFLLVLIFLVDRYRQKSFAAGFTPDAKIALRESKRHNDSESAQSRFCLEIHHERQACTDTCKEFCFLRVAISCAAALERYPLYRRRSGAVSSVCSLRLVVVVVVKDSPHVRPSPGRHSDSLYSRRRSYRSVGCLQQLPHDYVNDEKRPLVKGLVFRNSVIYKIPIPPPGHVRVRQSNPSQLLKAARGMEEVSLTAHEPLRLTVPETFS